MANLRLPEQNLVFLSGRLTADPVLRYTPQGQPVAHFDLAVNRNWRDSKGNWQKDTVFVPIVVWREAAMRCQERLKKGSAVMVQGSLRMREWETKDGQKRRTLEVVSQRIQFLTAPEEAAETSVETAEKVSEEVIETENSSEDIPF